MAAPPTILPLIKARMPNEVLQRIAQCLQDGKAMYAFLSALPDAWLTTPMAALATLYKDVRSGELANVNMTWLWPTLDMRNLPSIPDTLVPAFQAYAPMLPRIKANLDSHRQLCLPRDIPVTLGRVFLSEELTKVVNNWSQQLESLELELSPDELPIQHLCDALPRLPALRRLDVSWNRGSRPEETSALLDALLLSNVTGIWLRYDPSFANPWTYYRRRYEPTSTLQWTAREVTAFTRWIQAKPVTAVGLVDVPIDAANARTLARTLLQSQTLKSLHVDMGQLPRALFNLGLSLPKQLESLNTYVRHLDDVPGLTQTIAGSNLRKLDLGTQVPLETNVELVTNLTNVITSLPRLRELSLTNTALPLPTVIQLSEQLPSLTTLHLYKTNLDDAGMAVLARVLPSCRHLETLELCKQMYSHIAVQLLAKSIPHCPSLKRLNLAATPIHSRGLIALLPVLRCLDNVELFCCNIDDDGAAALCSVMDSTDDLYQLDLSWNSFSKDAMKHILRAVSKRTTRWGTVSLRHIIMAKDDEELGKRKWHTKNNLRNETWCNV